VILLLEGHLVHVNILLGHKIYVYIYITLYM
jgi:hypothetical protein